MRKHWDRVVGRAKSGCDGVTRGSTAFMPTGGHRHFLGRPTIAGFGTRGWAQTGSQRTFVLFSNRGGWLCIEAAGSAPHSVGRFGGAVATRVPQSLRRTNFFFLFRRQADDAISAALASGVRLAEPRTTVAANEPTRRNTPLRVRQSVEFVLASTLGSGCNRCCPQGLVQVFVFQRAARRRCGGPLAWA